MVDVAFSRLSTDEKMEKIYASILDLRQQVDNLSAGQTRRLGELVLRIDELASKVTQAKEVK